MTLPKILFLQAYNLPDAWARAIHSVLRDGQVFVNENNVKTKEMVSLIEVRNPLAKPMLHPQFPTKEKHLQEYIKEWERHYDWIGQGFSYNYRYRLSNYYGTDQIYEIRQMIAENTTRRLQAIIWQPNKDLGHREPPCLQRIWLRNLGNGTVDLHCMWRSRDLYNAWESNYIGLLHMICKEVLEPNNLRLARLVDYCDSLHIYEADWEAASRVKILPLNPQECYL